MPVGSISCGMPVNIFFEILDGFFENLAAGFFRSGRRIAVNTRFPVLFFIPGDFKLGEIPLPCPATWTP